MDSYLIVFEIIDDSKCTPPMEIDHYPGGLLAYTQADSDNFD